MAVAVGVPQNVNKVSGIVAFVTAIKREQYLRFKKEESSPIADFQIAAGQRIVQGDYDTFKQPATAEISTDVGIE